MVEYHGDVGLKVMIFKCSWFDTTENRGMRIHPSGLVDVSPRRQYAKIEKLNIMVFVFLEPMRQTTMASYRRL